MGVFAFVGGIIIGAIFSATALYFTAIDKTFAIVFSKARAEEMLKKVGRAYEMEEL